MRKNLFGAKSGFTIIEIIVAVMIVGILATIVVISYRGVTQKAVEASLQSDLVSAAEQLKIYKVQNGDSYPANYAMDCSATPAANTICFKTSSGNTIPTLLTDNTAKTFCIRAKNGSTNYFVTNSTQPVSGVCPGIPHTSTIAYTGAQQYFDVPADVYAVRVDAYGAAGGSGDKPGGAGAHIRGSISVNPLDRLYIYVGGQGSYNGGVSGGSGGYHTTCGGSTSNNGNGGGATDVRYGGEAASYRKIVAAGGGGGGSDLSGGDCGPEGYEGGSGSNGGAGTTCATGLSSCNTSQSGGGGGGGYRVGSNGCGGYDSGSCGGAGGSNYFGSTSGQTTYAANNSGDGHVDLYWETPS